MINREQFGPFDCLECLNALLGLRVIAWFYLLHKYVATIAHAREHSSTAKDLGVRGFSYCIVWYKDGEYDIRDKPGKLLCHIRKTSITPPDPRTSPSLP